MIYSLSYFYFSVAGASSTDITISAQREICATTVINHVTLPRLTNVTGPPGTIVKLRSRSKSKGQKKPLSILCVLENSLIIAFNQYIIISHLIRLNLTGAMCAMACINKKTVGKNSH